MLGQKKVVWTHHVRGKMRQYALSEQRVRRILHSPERIEEGIAPNTIAVMQPVSFKRVNGQRTWSQELWAMVQETKKERKIISAWRYPGKTKPGDAIPAEILAELKALL